MSFPPRSRGHPRYPVPKIASYCYHDRQFLTLTQDLGLGGMKIKTPHQLPEGEHLTFKLLLVNGSISLKGKIIYSRFLPDNESVSGVQFMGLSARAQSLLKDCLDSLEG